jgi:cell shape-determining protein MreC
MPRLHRKKRRAPDYTIAVIGLLLLVTFCFPAARQFTSRITRCFFAPFLALPENARIAISDKTLLIRSKLELASEMERLMQENMRLSAQVAQAAPLKLENEELRRLLKVSPRAEFRYIYARPLMRNPLDWAGGLTIDQGSESGISVGAVVVTPYYHNKRIIPAVLGRVVSVTGDTANIATLINPDCRLSVMVSGLGVSAGLIGGGHDASGFYTNAEYLPKGLKYRQDTPVYTAGFDAAVPPNLYLGQLDLPQHGELELGQRLYLSAKLRPAADLQAIYFVLIMVKEKK